MWQSTNDQNYPNIRTKHLRKRKRQAYKAETCIGFFQGPVDTTLKRRNFAVRDKIRAPRNLTVLLKARGRERGQNFVQIAKYDSCIYCLCICVYKADVIYNSKQERKIFKRKNEKQEVKKEIKK